MPARKRNARMARRFVPCCFENTRPRRGHVGSRNTSGSSDQKEAGKRERRAKYRCQLCAGSADQTATGKSEKGKNCRIGGLLANQTQCGSVTSRSACQRLHVPLPSLP